MIIFSLMAGLLSTMNIMSVRYDDIRIHLNDIYMVFLMTSWMMLFHNLYYFDNKSMFVYISAMSVVLCIYLIRNQVFINDTQFMKGMIPHHSMAILMAQKIKSKSNDTNILKLAKDIVSAQEKEITFIKSLGY